MLVLPQACAGAHAGPNKNTCTHTRTRTHKAHLVVPDLDRVHHLLLLHTLLVQALWAAAGGRGQARGREAWAGSGRGPARPQAGLPAQPRPRTW